MQQVFNNYETMVLNLCNKCVPICATTVQQCTPVLLLSLFHCIVQFICNDISHWETLIELYCTALTITNTDTAENERRNNMYAEPYLICARLCARICARICGTICARNYTRLRRWYITIPSLDQWWTTIENHRYQWLSYPKTIGKPLIPMVALNHFI